jgi:GntR family carbon starvation induced transcriptional regulator
MRAEKAGITLITRVFVDLRAQLLGGEFAPRQRLRVATLAGAQGVSVNVVREALNRLAGEGLIDVEPNCGFSVRDLSAADLVDVVAQRLTLESIALRLCIEHSSPDWQASVLAAHHRLRKTPLKLDDESKSLNPQWLSFHADFHRVMLEACGSPRLFQLIRQLADAAEMYHRALLPATRRDDEMEREHEDLLNAILAEDADSAIAILKLHLERTRDVMLPLLHELEEKNRARGGPPVQ